MVLKIPVLTKSKTGEHSASHAGEVCIISDSFRFEWTSSGPPLCHSVLSICFDVHLKFGVSAKRIGKCSGILEMVEFSRKKPFYGCP